RASSVADDKEYARREEHHAGDARHRYRLLREAERADPVEHDRAGELTRDRRGNDAARAERAHGDERAGDEDRSDEAAEVGPPRDARSAAEVVAARDGRDHDQRD